MYYHFLQTKSGSYQSSLYQTNEIYTSLESSNPNAYTYAVHRKTSKLSRTLI